MAAASRVRFVLALAFAGLFVSSAQGALSSVELAALCDLFAAFETCPDGNCSVGCGAKCGTATIASCNTAGTAITSISASNRGLATVPDSLGNLTQLTTLRLSNNPEIGSLPPDIFDAMLHLSSLFLERTNISALPSALSGLPLTYLSIEGNLFTSIPEEVYGLQDILYLDLDYNNFSLPFADLGLSIPSLEELYCDGCELSAVPESFFHFTSLTYLELMENPLVTLQPTIANLSNLLALELDYTALQQLPDAICEMSKLQALYIWVSELTSIPECIGKLNLSWIDLEENKLSRLPESFGSMRALEGGYLSMNQLTALPNSFCSLTQATRWYLYENKLTALPECFGSLAALSRLELSYNQLVSLPESFGSLAALSRLYIDNNQLTALPASMANLSNIENLDLDWNFLVCDALPENIRGFCDQERQYSCQIFNRINCSSLLVCHWDTSTQECVPGAPHEESSHEMIAPSSSSAPEGSNVWIIAVAVCGGVLLIALAAVAIVLGVKASRKKKNRRSAESAQTYMGQHPEKFGSANVTQASSLPGPPPSFGDSSYPPPPVYEGSSSSQVMMVMVPMLVDNSTGMMMPMDDFSGAQQMGSASGMTFDS